MPPVKRRPVLGPSAFLDHASGGKGRDEARRSQEDAWYQRVLEQRIAVRVRLKDGSELAGTIEWVDRGALRLNLDAGGHRILPKTALAYAERLS